MLAVALGEVDAEPRRSASLSVMPLLIFESGSASLRVSLTLDHDLGAGLGGVDDKLVFLEAKKQGRAADVGVLQRHRHLTPLSNLADCGSADGLPSIMCRNTVASPIRLVSG